MVSSTTGLMFMTTCGLTTTLWESSTHNMNEHLKDVWATEFPPDSLAGVGGLIRTVMTAIALARGLTLHIYIVAYILLVFPVLFERWTTFLLAWMLICAVRSLVVNLVALMTGCFLCSTYSELKQPCFEFMAAKAIEMSCSVYMWLSVNDFNISLKEKRRRHFLATHMKTKVTQIEESDLSGDSTDLSGTSFQDFEDEPSSDDSVMVKAAVEWLMKSAFGSKNGTKPDVTSKAQKFLDMSREELVALQNRIKDILFDDDGRKNQNDSKQNDRPAEPVPGTSNDQPEKTRSVISTGSQTKDPSRKLQARLETSTSNHPGTSNGHPSATVDQQRNTDDDKRNGSNSHQTESNPQADHNPILFLSRHLSRAPSDMSNQAKRNSYLRVIASSRIGPSASYDEHPGRQYDRQKWAPESRERRHSKQKKVDKTVTESWSEPSEFFQ